MLRLFAAVAFAADGVNKATEAELEAIKGIGPAIAGKIIDERKKGSFKDWNDMVGSVKGVGGRQCREVLGRRVTVNGAAFAVARPRRWRPPRKPHRWLRPRRRRRDEGAACGGTGRHPRAAAIVPTMLGKAGRERRKKTEEGRQGKLHEAQEAEAKAKEGRSQEGCES